MHLGIERNLFYQVGSVGLQRAAAVSDGNSSHLPDYAVGDHRRNLSRYEFVLPAVSPTYNDVIALVDLAQELLDIGGVILQVSVHGDEYLPDCIFDSGRHSRGLAVIAPEPHHADPRVETRDSASALQCLILAAIVDEQHLKSDSERFKRGDDCCVQWGDAVL